MISQAQLEKKVEGYLRSSEVLEGYWQRAITAEQLQADLDRMAQHTKQPNVLRELFEALGNDPYVIAECLARSTLIDHLFQSVEHSQGPEANHLISFHHADKTPFTGYTLPLIATTSNAEGTCIVDTWTATNTNAPIGRGGYTAVWTGSEMIIWGGVGGLYFYNTTRPLAELFTRQFGLVPR